MCFRVRLFVVHLVKHVSRTLSSCTLSSSSPQYASIEHVKYPPRSLSLCEWYACVSMLFVITFQYADVALCTFGWRFHFDIYKDIYWLPIVLLSWFMLLVCAVRWSGGRDIMGICQECLPFPSHIIMPDRIRRRYYYTYILFLSYFLSEVTVDQSSWELHAFSMLVSLKSLFLKCLSTTSWPHLSDLNGRSAS